jgi:taurine dioxygenase
MTATTSPRVIGTRVPGVNLRLEGADPAAAAAQFARVEAALHAHGVVVLPGQSPTREQLHLFAQRWGPIALHIGQGANEYPGMPGMLTINDGFSDDDPAPEPGATEFGPTWHCDFAACAKPGYATVLNCQSTPTGPRPEDRCDTLFADLVAAYDALPEPEQRELQSLKVRVSYGSRELHPDIFMHDSVAKRNMVHYSREEAKALIRDLRPDVEHPLVRSVLGRPVLFFGQVDTSFRPGPPWAVKRPH